MVEKEESKVPVEKKADDGGEKKAVDSGATVVLKLDLHCEGCAKKVRRSVANLEGVVKVKSECDAKKLTVTGNVDPAWLRDTVETKTKKKVELISPPPLNLNHDHDQNNKTTPKQQRDDVVVVMKIRLHCEGCAHKIRRLILKNIDGVKAVTTDLPTNLVTVTGTMDAKQLAPYLKEKLKRSIEIVPPKNKEDEKNGDQNNEEKKGEENVSGGGGDDKEKDAPNKEEEEKEKEKEKEKENENSGGKDEDKKEKDAHKNETKNDGEEDKKEGESGGKMEVSKMEQQMYNPETYFVMPMAMEMGEYNGAMYHNGDEGEYSNSMQYREGPPPTYFSDENPNGCFLM